MSGVSDAPVIDLTPFIQARRTTACSHPRVVVDETIASLVCDVCQGEIDPWWYLRKMAHDHQAWIDWHAQQSARMQAETQALTTTNDLLRAQNEVLAQEVCRLEHQRDALGRPRDLSVTRRRRPRK